MAEVVAAATALLQTKRQNLALVRGRRHSAAVAAQPAGNPGLPRSMSWVSNDHLPGRQNP